MGMTIEDNADHDKKASISCSHENDLISRQTAIDAIEHITSSMSVCVNTDECHGMKRMQRQAVIELVNLPSAQPEWNNHTVACLLAELFDDPCACNYNGIDEWLPEKCEVVNACPNPAGVACWEQYLKHRAERRTDDCI